MSEDRARREELLWELLSIVAIVALAATILYLSWNRWLEPIIDLGRDLYVPSELARGKLLYRDILYFYPPTAPYLLAAVVTVIGAGLSQYTFIGISIAALAAAALYLIVRSVVSPAAGVGVLLMFVLLNLAGATTWGANWIFPYAHAATLAMTFFLWFVFFLLRSIVSASRSTALAAMLFGVLAASTKVEYVMAVGVVTLVATLVYRFPVRYAIGAVAAGLATIAILSVVFDDDRPGHHWIRDNIFPSSLTSSDTASLFYAQVSGRESIAQNLLTSALGLIGIVACIAILMGIERSLLNRQRALAGALLAFFVVATWFVAGERFFMASNVMLLFALLWGLRERGRSPLLLVATAAAVTSFRIIFTPGPWWYGFVIILPTYVAVAYVLFRALPERGLYSRRVALLWLAVIAVSGVRGAEHSLSKWEERTHEVRTERGRFFETPPRGAALSSLLRAIEAQPRGTLAVMPEGLAINYFTRRATSLSYQTFTPIEIADPEVERRIVEELQASAPDLIAIVPRDVREFGYRGFGIDYAVPILQELHRGYRPLARGGEPDFPWILLGRKESAGE
jgi:hypothetical protein